MELVCWLPPGKDDCQASELAAEFGITAVPISRQSLEPLPRGGLLLGFAGTNEEGIRQGVPALAAALELL
jgi:GntR family transcriptional regulator/MocR family aminotransferase